MSKWGESEKWEGNYRTICRDQKKNQTPRRGALNVERVYFILPSDAAANISPCGFAIISVILFQKDSFLFDVLNTEGFKEYIET